MEKLKTETIKTKEEIETEIKSLSKTFFEVLQSLNASRALPITIDELIQEPDSTLKKVMAKYDLEDYGEKTLARIVEKILKLKDDKERKSIHYNPS